MSLTSVLPPVDPTVPPRGMTPSSPTVDPAAATPRARWVRPALIALLVLTAVGYIWDLGASGDANSFYAAAVQAGTKSWKAFFFGSIDSSNFITVDKPPGSLWIMELSGRLFGFSTWSMLVPQALEGVAAVGIVYATVKRWFGAGAGLLAGAVLALTPVAALMFRFNNPDALLVLLLTAAAYALIRSLEKAGTRWLVAAGALLGFAFLTKMLQAFTVLPAFALVYLVAAPTRLRRRLGQLAIGGLAVVVAGGWWVAAVALWPAADRPLIDGSPNNSILNLIFGYNGFARIYSSGGGGGGGGGSSFSGTPGIFRLFNDLMGGQASWLIPAALITVVAGLVWRRRAPRTDRARAALLLWGGWLVVTAAVFSFGEGTIHTYYTVALAPAVAALVGIGASVAWKQRHSLVARLLAAAAIAVSSGWAYKLLDRSPSYHPWLRVVVVVAGGLAVLACVAAGPGARFSRQFALGAAGLALVACLSGPLAYSATTVTTPHTGSIPSAGPAISAAGAGGGPGGGGGALRSGSGGFGAPGGGASRSGAATGAPPSGSGLTSGTESGTAGGFGFSGSTGAGSSSASAARGGAGGTTSVGGGGAGGVSTSHALSVALRNDASKYRWVAATFGSQSAASLELASDEPVMAIGGFNSQGGNISSATFESYVSKGDVHYFIASGGGGGASGGGSDNEITIWVEAHFSSTTIGGVTVYDLSSQKA